MRSGGTNAPTAARAAAPSVLVISLHYAPEPTGIAPYSTGLAEYLAGRGWNTTVVAGVPFLPTWRVHPGFEGRDIAIRRENGVEVRRVRQYVPTKQSALSRARLEASFLARSAGAVRSVGRHGLIAAVVPSLGSAIVARHLARKWRVPYVVIVQDMISRAAAQSGVSGGRHAKRVVESLERYAFHHAQGIAVVADGFRARLQEMGLPGIPVVHVPNWTHITPAKADPAAVRTRFGWQQDQYIVLHAGNMGLKQGLENVVAAARLAAHQRLPFRFVFLGGGNQHSFLTSLAAGLPNVQFMEAQAADLFPSVLAAADVLLVNERATVQDMSLPSKLTSYFAAGRPVVAAVRAGGTTSRELEKAGAGMVVAPDDPTGLLGALTSLRSDPELQRTLGNAGRRYAQARLTAAASLAAYERFFRETLARAEHAFAGDPGSSGQGAESA